MKQQRVETIRGPVVRTDMDDGMASAFDRGSNSTRSARVVREGIGTRTGVRTQVIAE